MTSKKPKKSKEKVKKIEETTTTDSDIVVNSPSLINPTHINLPNPKSPSETIGFPSLSIPVPHSSVSSTNGLISSDPSRIRTPQQSNSKCLYLIKSFNIFVSLNKQLHIYLKFNINYKQILKIHL